MRAWASCAQGACDERIFTLHSLCHVERLMTTLPRGRALPVQNDLTMFPLRIKRFFPFDVLRSPQNSCGEETNRRYLKHIPIFSTRLTVARIFSLYSVHFLELLLILAIYNFQGSFQRFHYKICSISW